MFSHHLHIGEGVQANVDPGEGWESLHQGDAGAPPETRQIYRRAYAAIGFVFREYACGTVVVTVVRE
ncbi:hypothetical protein BDW59DRAFT_65245 [Aspergillus cavernicola]|uniref:Uncharacterized protein n=1 Tax=Aspergillus cavernicola TaxID=176166 RepID=A0ABR4IGT4_9EURO